MVCVHMFERFFSLTKTVCLDLWKASLLSSTLAPQCSFTGNTLIQHRVVVNLLSNAVCAVMVHFNGMLCFHRSCRRCCMGPLLIGGLSGCCCMRCYQDTPPLRPKMKMTSLSPSSMKRLFMRLGSARRQWTYWKLWVFSFCIHSNLSWTVKKKSDGYGWMKAKCCCCLASSDCLCQTLFTLLQEMYLKFFLSRANDRGNQFLTGFVIAIVEKNQ